MFPNISRMFSTNKKSINHFSVGLTSFFLFLWELKVFSFLIYTKKNIQIKPSGSRRHLRSPTWHSFDADKPVASTEDINSPLSHFLALGHGGNFLMEHLPPGSSQLSSQLHLCHQSNRFCSASPALLPAEAYKK